MTFLTEEEENINRTSPYMIHPSIPRLPDRAVVPGYAAPDLRVLSCLAGPLQLLSTPDCSDSS